MQREKKDYAVITFRPLFKWHQCGGCKKEFILEKGFKIYDRRGNDLTQVTTLCSHCAEGCKTDEEILLTATAIKAQTKPVIPFLKSA